MTTPLSKPKKRKKRETSIQIEAAKYLRLKYPDVIFTSESGGIRVTMGQAVLMKRLRSGSKLPDMMIDEPRGIFHGLRLELKEEDNSPFKKDGSLTRKWDKKQQVDVIREQATMLDRLKKKGYYAKFSVGMAQVIEDIDYYMSLPPNYHP